MMNTMSSESKKQKRLSEEVCKELYAKYETPERVIKHCRAVGETGARIASALNKAGYNFDVSLVRVAGLIHDLMRISDNHGEAAADLLESLGYVQEAKAVRNHMRYKFNAPENITETDIFCLADRLVKEDEYVGIDERVDYLINKPGKTAERTKILIEKREETKIFIKALEIRMGVKIDSLFRNDDSAKKIDRLLKRVEKPARYIGSEKNICKKKPQNKLRFAFAFPDLYEIGMSYMGLQILYNILNKEDEIYCERVFAPAQDMSALMREEKLDLFTLETKTSVRDMDVLGFTLQYEMSYTNILDMLSLAGITFKSKDRAEDEPLIIAGGPCAYNPEPLSDFIDVFLIGDGEELLPHFLKEYKKSLEKGVSKREFLKSIVKTDGVYIPSFYDVVYNEDNTVKEYVPLIEDAPKRVKRALISEIEDIPFPERPMVPFIDTVHDRAVVETFRGCTRGCRFCQAGMIYRPIRERSKETIERIVERQLETTGHDELSLLSLSTSDYSDFEALATSVMDKCADRNVALSLPSLRLDSFSFNVLQEIQKYRKSGLTFAPEAGTQRLRDVINKGITEEDIFSAVRQAIELGWNNIKLYFMIGHPTETDEDLEGIANIAKKILQIKKEVGRGGRFNVTVSVSNFVPKAFTPFQWMGQNSLEEFRRKHDFLRGLLYVKGITFNYHDDFTSVLEAVFARGDRRTGKLLLKAYEEGCVRDSWSECFDEQKWRTAIEKSGLDIEFYTQRERDTDEVLPWYIIDSSVSDEYLKLEWKRANVAQITPDCRNGCTGCGINKRTVCKLGGIYE